MRAFILKMGRMYHSKKILAGIALAALIAPTMAIAQDSADVLVMRRVISKKAAGGNTPTPTPGDPTAENPGPLTPVEGSDLADFHWVTSGWFNVQACSASANQERLVGCVKNGQQADQALCPQPKPATTRAVENYDTCTFSWEITGYGDWASHCSSHTTRETQSVCKRSDGTTAANGDCVASAKPAAQSGEDLSSCTYSWTSGNYGNWSTTCGANATHTRSVTCIRSDEEIAQNGLCDPATKPVSQETADNFSNCSYAWAPGEWVEPAPTCSATALKTRTVVCKRADGSPAEDASCTVAKPETTQTVANYEACSYGWATGSYGDWNSTCSATAIHTRPVTCLRADGQTSAEDNCTETKPQASETLAIYSGCTYAWDAGEWSTTPSCTTNAVQTRAVTCKRSDGTAANDAQCTDTKPATTNSIPDYSSCSYAWIPGEWSGYDSSCSTTATRTRAITCHRSDDSIAPDASCTTNKPASSESTEIYSGCAYAWAPGSWGAWSSECSTTATRSRIVTCQRTGPGSTVTEADASNCTVGTKPATSETSSIQTGCTAVTLVSSEWVNGNWSAPSSTCSAAAVETRSVVCTGTYSDGSKAPLADAQCTETKPATSQTLATTSGCSYSWDPQAWGNYNSTCSASATKTRTVYCNQTDPSTGLATRVANALCTANSATGEGNATFTGPNVTDCGGVLVNGNFEAADTGWTYTGAKVTIRTGTTGGAHGGLYSAVWPGTTDTSGSISQKINTFPIQYTLSFWCYGSLTQKASWNINGQSGSCSNVSGAAAWAQTNATFTGSGGQDTLTFTISNVVGTVLKIDDVIVSNSGP